MKFDNSNQKIMQINCAQTNRDNFLAHTTESNRLFFELLGVGQEQYCRYLWIRRIVNSEIDHVNKWLPIGNANKKRCDLQNRDDIFQAVASERPGDDTVDYFLSPNEFFGWRCIKGVSRLHANYIDIDTTTEHALSEQEQQIVIREVFDQLSASQIPLPNAIVKSGSGGLHLYWVYEPTDAYKWRVEFWREFTRAVINILGSGKSWKVDVQASMDPSRVLRLPGSQHYKSKRQVQAYVVNERFDFNSLYNTANIHPVRPNHLTLVHSALLSDSENDTGQQKRKISKPKLQVYQANGRHNIRAWWTNVYEQVRFKCSTLGVPKGQRDYAAYILFVARLNATEDVSEAIEKITADNDEFIHLSEKELSSYLSTAKSKKYRYKKETLARYLEQNLAIDADFLYQSEKKARLTPAQVREKQSEAALKTASKKRSQTVSILRNALFHLRLKASSVSITDLVRDSGLSRRTVYRYWDEITTADCAIRSVSI